MESENKINNFFHHKSKKDKEATMVDLIVAPLVWLAIFIFALVILFNGIGDAKNFEESDNSKSTTETYSNN